MRQPKAIFHQALLLTGINLLLRLVSTSYQVFLSGRIGAAGIGLLQMVLSVASLSMTAGIAGIRTTAMYLCAEETGHRRSDTIFHILCVCCIYSLCCSALVGLDVWLAAPRLARDWIGNTEILSSVRLFAACLPVTCLCGVFSGYFMAANRIKTLAAVQAAEQVVSMAVCLLLLSDWAGTDTGRACFSVICGSCVGSASTLLSLSVLCRRTLPNRSVKTPVCRRLAGIAVPLALADDLKAGISAAENLMVPRRLALCHKTADPMALVGILLGMVFPVMMFPAAILYALAELLIPELARCRAAGSQQRICYLIRRSLRITMLYGAALAGILCFAADPLCRMLYKEGRAGQFLQLFLPLLPMLYCDIITDAATKGLGQQRVCVRYNIITSALDVALLYLLLPRWGVSGYAASFALTHLLNFILSLRRLLRITGLTLSCRDPVLTAGACGAAIAAAGLLPGPGWQITGFVTVFGCLLILTGVLSPEDLRWMGSFLKKTDLPQ